MSLRIVVVEDEEIVARRLMRLVGVILGDEVGSMKHLPSLDDAIAHIVDNPIDLLFLDLNLHGQDGFRLLGEAVAGPFETIVVSAHLDEAVRAFEFGVTDFVAKPYDEERLRKAIARVRQRDDDQKNRLRYLAVRKGREVVPLLVDEVVYFKGADDYTEIHCRDGSVQLHDKTLKVMEHLLPSRFERVHRSYIVNTRMIESYRSEPGSRYLLQLVTGERIPVSRTRFKELKRRLL